MRAKFEIIRIQQDSNPDGTMGNETLTMQAVCSGSYGPNGENEDNSFARWSPFGNLSITIANPDLIGKYKPGQRFYLDFTEVPCREPGLDGDGSNCGKPGLPGI